LLFLHSFHHVKIVSIYLYSFDKPASVLNPTLPIPTIEERRMKNINKYVSLKMLNNASNPAADLHNPSIGNQYIQPLSQTFLISSS
jgi:hypothetical protein